MNHKISGHFGMVLPQRRWSISALSAWEDKVHRPEAYLPAGTVYKGCSHLHSCAKGKVPRRVFLAHITFFVLNNIVFLLTLTSIDCTWEMAHLRNGADTTTSHCTHFLSPAFVSFLQELAWSLLGDLGHMYTVLYTYYMFAHLPSEWCMGEGKRWAVSTELETEHSNSQKTRRRVSSKKLF